MKGMFSASSQSNESFVEYLKRPEINDKLKENIKAKVQVEADGNVFGEASRIFNDFSAAYQGLTPLSHNYSAAMNAFIKKTAKLGNSEHYTTERQDQKLYLSLPGTEFESFIYFAIYMGINDLFNVDGSIKDDVYRMLKEAGLPKEIGQNHAQFKRYMLGSYVNLMTFQEALREKAADLVSDLLEKGVDLMNINQFTSPSYIHSKLPNMLFEAITPQNIDEHFIDNITSKVSRAAHSSRFSLEFKSSIIEYQKSVCTQHVMSSRMQFIYLIMVCNLRLNN